MVIFFMLLVFFCVLRLTAGSNSCVLKYLNEHGFRGYAEFPGSSDYNDTVAIDNVRVAAYPDIAIVPSDENDVSVSLLAAQTCDVLFSVRSGGHSAAGYCLSSGGVTLDMKGMNQVKYLSGDAVSGRMFVESGAKWADVYSVAHDTPYVPIGGGCPTVAAGGFLLGGGWSFLSRSYGLGCDNIISLRLVLANGTIITASRIENTDLFWASRGGGGGNFGITLSFVINMPVPRSDVMVVGDLCWEGFQEPLVTNVWSWWLNYHPISPAWMLLEPSWLPLDNSAQDPRLFCFTVICNGKPDAECFPEIDPILTQYPPKVNTLAVQSYVDWQVAKDPGVTDPSGRFLYLTSGILPPGALTTALTQKLTAALQESPSVYSLILFHTGGGKITEVSAVDSAFVHRNTELVIQIKAIWENEDEEDVNIEWVKSTRAIVESILSGSYVNYIDSLLPDWQTAYYGDNYDRLLELKHQYDPYNFFSFNQSIGQ